MLTQEHEFVSSDTIIELDQSLDGPQKQILWVLNLSVIHSENDRPISNALISIDSIGKTAICNSDGELCINELMPGTYDIDIISPGFIAQRISVLILPYEAVEIEVKMISNC
jgi:hypothetical protein